jgi:hypothetical protein
MKLAVGLILIFMSIVHVFYGEKVQVNVLKKLGAGSVLIGSCRAMSLQGGLLLFAIGLLEIMVYTGFIEVNGIAVYIPLIILCLNVIAVFIVAALKHRDLIRATIPQFIIFLFIILLEVLSVI